MRFKLFFKGELCPHSDKIRKSFISFIKKVFKSASEEKYNALFSSKKVKPYCYSPFLGESLEENIIGPNISFIFSSGDYEIISSFWNGIIILSKEKNDHLEINGKRFNLSNILLLPNKDINSDRVIFKTIGVSILTDPFSSPADFKKWYIIPEKENMEKFNEVLKVRVKQRYKLIKGKEIEPDLKFSLIENYPIKETIIPLFNGYLRGFRGYFLLEGNKKILKFLYDFGFGVRTGQGFGLLEIVKQL